MTDRTQLQDTFFNEDRLRSLVELCNLYNQFKYGGAHNTLTAAQSKRMAELQAELHDSPYIEPLIEVARIAAVIMGELKVQGVNYRFDRLGQHNTRTLDEDM